jgi:4-hydroxy-4-methyl-2-oxoglutarate aldolase
MIKEKVIRHIEENKISSTEVADVLGKTGAVNGVSPLNPRHFKVGEVAFIYALNGSNWEVHEQIANIDCENKIVYVHSINCTDKAIFGDLVSKYLFLYKKCKAVVVNGLMRDAHRLIKENYPIWATGVTPIGCVNVKSDGSNHVAEIEALRKTFDKGVMVCDDSGVVLIKENQVSEELIQKLKFIELQEDIWYFCLDTHKMSTYEIVCEKKYLKQEGLVDPHTIREIANFSTDK